MRFLRSLVLAGAFLFGLLFHLPPTTPDFHEREEPEEWYVAQRLHGLSLSALQRADRQALQLRRTTLAKSSETMGPAWQFVGPTNIPGRVLDLAMDPGRSNTIYAGTATGGLWVSRDGGSKFTSVWPNAYSQAIGAVAMAPNGLLWVGTGETGPGGGSLTYGGDGVYYSRNSGKAWVHAGLSLAGSIGRIVIDPKNPNQIYVAAAGSLFTPGGERGLYRSQDGGVTWQLICRAANSTTGAVDVVVDPSKPDRIFVAMWDRQRKPDQRRYGGAGSGVYMSMNGGTSWKRITNGLPSPSASIGRIGIAMAPSNPRRMFAIITKADGTLQGLYASMNGGTAWKKLPDDPILKRSQYTFGWWFGRVWVDPRDDKHVFVGGGELLESTTGGTSWTFRIVHADQHAMAWDLKTPNRVYLGNDGGVFRSDANGSGGWIRGPYQPFTQFYGLDVDERDPTRITGGAQDNGCIRSFPGWRTFLSGDGQRTLFDFRNSQKVYACRQYGNCYSSTDGGFIFHAFSSNTVSSRRNWSTPMELDPRDPSILYYAGERLNRSTNGGVSWTAISGDLTGGPGRSSAYPYGTITTIAISKSDGRTIYAGTDDGRINVTRDLGSTWTRVNDPALPSHWVTRLAVADTSPSKAYAVFSGYRSGVQGAYVFKTTNGGVSWSDIGNGLPAAPINDILSAGNVLYVASDLGVFISRNDGQTWLVLGSGLPKAPVTDLRFISSNRTLYAATYGRGIYKLKL